MKHLRVLLAFSAMLSACGSVTTVADGYYEAAKTPVSLEEQGVTAIHEAAHVFVELTLTPDSPVTGVMVATAIANELSDLGGMLYPKSAKIATPARRAAIAPMALSGAAAEKFLLNRTPHGCQNDFRVAALYCHQSKSCLDDAAQKAESLVRGNAEVIRGLAKLIMSQPIQNDLHYLSSEDIRKFLREHSAPPPTN